MRLAGQFVPNTWMNPGKIVLNRLGNRPTEAQLRGKGNQKGNYLSTEEIRKAVEREEQEKKSARGSEVTAGLKAHANPNYYGPNGTFSNSTDRAANLVPGHGSDRNPQDPVSIETDVSVEIPERCEDIIGAYEKGFDPVPEMDAYSTGKTQRSLANVLSRERIIGKAYGKSVKTPPCGILGVITSTPKVFRKARHWEISYAERVRQEDERKYVVAE